MKVYSAPEELPYEVDYQNYDFKVQMQKEEDHKKSLKEWLISSGMVGPNTGRIFSTPKADGYANYMFADGGKTCFLVHLPYGDGWHDPDVQYLPKREVLKRISLMESLPAWKL